MTAVDRMRLTALALLVGLASAASALFTPWATGKEYVYRLHAISLSDIGDLGPQAAGIKFDSQLIVHCRDVNAIVVKLIDVTASSFHADVDDGWDLLESNAGTPVSIDGKMYLERPFVVRHKNGLFESMSVSQDEPLWSVNMKRAVASKLLLHVSGSRSVESASRNFGFGAVSEEVNAVFKVLEDGITGECETLYEIAPLSDALIRSDSKLNPVPELCAQDSYFQIVKTTDYSKCRVRPVLNVIAPSGWDCKPGASTCSTAVSRSSVSRYVACGSRESFTLLKFTHQGELRANPYGYDTEQLRDFSLMKIVLQAVRPVSSLAKNLDVSLIINSLVYSFVGKVTDGSRSEGGRMRMPPLREIDRTSRTFNFAELRVEIRRMLDNVEREMTGHGDVASRGVIDAISSISRLIRHLDFQEIATLVSDASNSRTDESGQSSVRTVLLDAVMAAGSNPAVMYLKEAVANQRLSRTESIQALSGLPLYIRTPTPEMLNELLNLLKTTSIGPDRSIFHVATLAVSKVIHTACVNGTEARTRFPVDLYGNFCSSDDPVIVNKLVPFLAKEVTGSGRVEDKMVALTALGEVGHESIIPVVVPVIEGKVDYSPMIRTKAVVSLHKLAHDSNERVIHILSTIYQNPSESTEVRMAAFTLLVLANPPAFRWQKMAVSTWFEPSAQMASFVYTTLYSLANHVLPLENLKDASEKAQAVLPLAKPAPIGLKSSFNLKWSNVVPERNAGAEFHSELFNSEESLWPKSFYSRLSWALGPYHFDVFELEAYAENLKNAWDRIWTEFFPQPQPRPPASSGSEQTDATRPISPRFPEFEWHADLQQMKKQLNAKIPSISEDSGTPEAFIHLSLMKAIHRYASLDEDGFRSAVQGLPRIRQLLEGEGTNLNWQKWMPLTNAEVLMPNSLGFLVTTRVHAQILTSVRGNLKSAPAEPTDASKEDPDPSRGRPQSGAWFGNPSVEANIKPTFVFKLLAKMGVDVGFTRYVTMAGVDTNLMATLPGFFRAGLDLENWKLLLSWKPATGESSKLFRFQVRPFTSLVMNTDIQPVTTSPNTRDVSAAGASLQTDQDLVGEKLGLKLLYQSQSELPIAKETWTHVPSASDWLTKLNFALLPASLHRQSHVLTLNPAASETKKIIFYVNIDAADRADSGTRIYRSGSKSLIPVQDAPDGLRVISANVEPIVQRKLTKVLDIVKEGTAVHVDAKLIMDGDSARVYGASLAAAYGTEGTKLAVNAQIDFPLDDQVTAPSSLCMEGEGTYPWLPSLERRALIDAHLEAKWSAKIGFGATCADNQIAVKADLKRSDEFARRIRESAENGDCEIYEAQGEVSHEKCLIVKDLSFVLDEYDISIQYTNMTPSVLNASLGLERFFKAWLYPHVSDNEVDVRNEEKRVRIVAKVHDSLDAVNVMVFKPRSNTFYHDVPLSPVVNVVFPLSARASVTERITDYTINDGYAPTCRLEKNSITTFDRVQYGARLNDCNHVVLAAPGTDSIGVLVRREEERKVVTLLVGRDKLEVDALAKVVRYNDIDVVVAEDQPMAVHDDRGVGRVAGIFRVGPDTFKMVTPVFGIQIVTDGKSVAVKAPRSFQGRLIGLCGNMDGETVSELRDPRQCILSSGPIMAASYLLNKQSKCSGIPEDIRGQLRQEQANCVKYVRFPFPINGSGADGGSCSVQRTVVVFRGNRTCFSTLTITECKASCQPIDTTAKNIGFHCIEDPKLANIMEQEAQNRPMSSMVGKREDFRHTIYAPTGCQGK